MVSGSSTVVEQVAHNPEIEGLNPAAGTVIEKNGEEEKGSVYTSVCGCISTLRFRFDLLGCSEHIDECRQRRQEQRRRRQTAETNNDVDHRRQLIVKPIIITEEPPSQASYHQNNQVTISSKLKGGTVISDVGRTAVDVFRRLVIEIGNL
jgi:hypothetical protein